MKFLKKKTGWKPALQKRLSRDARAGVDAETVSAARQAIWQRTASLRGERGWPGNAAARNGQRRRAEGDRGRGQRTDVLRIRAPIKRLIAELHVQISRRPHEIDAGRIETGA